jgi:hypothetical protein
VVANDPPPPSILRGLLDLDVARPCADADGWASAIDYGADVVAVKAALHRHWLRHRDVS